MQKLREMLTLSEEWAVRLSQMLTWLTSTEKRLQELGNIPIEPERIEAQIDAQKVCCHD